MNNLLSISRVRDAVVKTAKMLAQDSVQIRQRGGKPYVAYKPNGEVDYVNLPVIPDKPSEQFIKCLHGFMDHEVAHVLFTKNLETRQVLEEARRAGYKEDMVKSFANCFEDVRIERAMAGRYEGAAYNFTNSLKYVLNESVLPNLEEIRKQPPGEERDTAMMHASFLAYARMKGGDDDARAFMDEQKLHPFFETIDKAFPDMSDRLTKMNSSGDAARVAYDFVKSITPTPPESEEEPDEGDGEPDGSAPPPPESEDDSEGDGGKGKQDKPKDEDGDEDKEDKPKQTSAGAGEGDDMDGDEGEPGEGEPEDGDGEPGDGEGEGDGDGEPGDGEGEGDGEPIGGEGGGDADTSAIFDKFAKDGGPDDMDEAMTELISGLVTDEFKGAKYADYTFEDDVIDTAPIIDKISIERMETDVQQISATMQKDLQRLIMARSQSIMVPGFRSGRINPSALHRLKTGDDRVFRRKHEADNLDVAITLLIDLSGSMNSGNKIGLALRSAWAFSQVLDKLNVSHEVLGFTTTPDSTYGSPKTTARQNGAREFAAQMGIPFGSVRWEALNMPIFKEFGERFSLDVKRRLASVERHSVTLLENVDGACVKIAATRLLQRTEKRKVLMVFSDGSPSSRMSGTALTHHLKDVVKQVEGSGVETIGIGIMNDSVKTYYPKNFVVNNLGELPAKVIGELRQILMK